MEKQKLLKSTKIVYLLIGLSISLVMVTDVNARNSVYKNEIIQDQQTSIKVLNNDDNCLINCESEIEICNKKSLFSSTLNGNNFDIWFLDKENKEITGLNRFNNKNKLKEFDILKKTEVFYDVDVIDWGECTKEVCIINNETMKEECENIYSKCKVDSHVEERTRWEYVPINPHNKDLIIKPNSCEIFKIKGKKKANEDVDWKIKVFDLEPDWAWWSGDWGKRVNLTVTNNEIFNLWNYTIEHNLTHNENMTEDFSDLRFTWYNKTLGDEEEIGYWVRDNVSSTNAYVLFLIPKISTDGETVFMYYNNSDVSSTSDVNKAVLFGDDFNYENMDWDKWDNSSSDVASGQDYYNIVDNSYLNLTAYETSTGYTNTRLNSSYNFDMSNKFYHIKLKLENTADTGYCSAIFLYLSDMARNDYSSFRRYYHGARWDTTIVNDTNSDSNNGLTVSPTYLSTWNNASMRANDTYIDMWDSDSLLSSSTFPYLPYDSDDIIQVMIESSASGYGVAYRWISVHVDWLYLRNYTDNEPSINMGDEEDYELVSVLNITSCQSLDQANTTYYLMNSINNHSGNCFIIGADNVTLDCQNYLVDGVNSNSAVVVGTDNDYLTVKDCHFNDWSLTVYMNGDNSDDGVFNNNTFTSSQYGLYSNHINRKHNITNNHFEDLTNGGIYTSAVTTTYWNIKYNTFTNVGNSNYGAIRLYGQHSTVSYNVMDNCKYGVYRSGNSHSNITHNTFKNGEWGIMFMRSINNDVYGNNITNNSVAGVEWYCTISDCQNNLLYNNLLNNTVNVIIDTDILINDWNTTEQLGTRIFGSGNNIGGNYWSFPNATGYSETCTDSDSDGFCDNPYILIADNTDYLPLSNNYTSPTTTTTTIMATTTTIELLPIGNYTQWYCSDNLLVKNYTAEGENSTYEYIVCEYNCSSFLGKARCNYEPFVVWIVFIVLLIGIAVGLKFIIKHNIFD